jgi:hypothetical protein
VCYSAQTISRSALQIAEFDDEITSRSKDREILKYDKNAVPVWCSRLA